MAMAYRGGLITVVLGLGLSTGAAFAQEYPTRPISMVAPFAAGGPVDLVARVFGKGLSESLGQPVLIENRDGAAGTIGTAYVAKAKPDGYTVLFGSPSAIVFAPSIYGDRLPYNAQTDLIPISLVGADSSVVVVGASVKASTLPELVALARKEPGKINYGSPGQGSPIHLAGMFLEKLAGISMVHVPYRGVAPAMNDIMAGTIQMTFPSVSGSLSFLQTGKLKAIAVMASERSQTLPDVPTTAEQGFPDFIGNSWSGLLAPKSTPSSVVGRLSTGSVAALKSPDVQAFLKKQSITPVGSNSAAFAKIIAADTARWAPLIKAAGLKPD